MQTASNVSMGKISKGFSLLLVVVLAASSLMIFESVSAQSIPKPSVPEFTVQLINASYSVVDPYTGVSHLEDNSTIQVKIKNQPFTYSNNGISYRLYYNVRTRPHFEGNWTERYPVIDRPNSPFNTATNSFSSSKYLTDEFHPSLPAELNSDYTIVFYVLNGENAYYQFEGLPSNAQVDFEVEAIVGHDSQAWYVQHPLYPNYGGFYESAVAYDTDSGWSNAKTITIGTSTPSATPNTSPSQNSSASPNPTPTPTPAVPEFSILIIVPLLLAISLITSKLLQKKQLSKSL
jgi:hypothetical protein